MGVIAEGRRNGPRSGWVTFLLLSRGCALLSLEESHGRFGGVPQIRARHEFKQPFLDFYQSLYMMGLLELPVEV